MTEEPYRWLEAVANRREYVLEQLKGGSPVFGVSLDEGILLLGLGSGQSKVFELFDRHALAGLGHPADLEKIRQAAIDAAHMEAFNRAPEDVSLRRLVSFGLGPQLKTAFEQIFSAPFLVELLLAEIGTVQKNDSFFLVHFDGSFQLQAGGVVVVASTGETQAAAQEWLSSRVKHGTGREEAIQRCLQAWWLITQKKNFDAAGVQEAEKALTDSVKGRVVEIGWLSRKSNRPARYEELSYKPA